ncbi:MAG: patatin-like phospholipase family protein [Actinomycetota bacterium]
MTRALVLGGGGPVGIGWESGLAVGLAQEGVVLGEADLIVGTSAGSVVGSRLALQLDLPDLVSSVSRPLPVAPGASGAVGDLMSLWADAAARQLTPEEVRAELGKLALTAPVGGESTFVTAEIFAWLEGHEWPASFRCTAVDTRTGTLRVWDDAAGVPLRLGVASSCSVPGVFPPVTIGADRYMDGGMRTPLNADLAAGYDAVTVISCLPLALPEGFSDPVFDSMLRQVESELAAERVGGAVEVIVPGQEFLDISGWGANLMDPSRATAAYEAGLRQAMAETARLRAVWNG